MARAVHARVLARATSRFHMLSVQKRMLLTYHIEDNSPTPDLQELIEKQRKNGGRLVQYRRAWAAVAVIATQDRIVWVAQEKSRHFAGWRQSLFTCTLGLWSIMSFFAVPIILFSNFSGGIDVTEFYSSAAIDPFRSVTPIQGTAAREAKRAQWSMLGFLIVVLATILIAVLQ